MARENQISNAVGTGPKAQNVGLKFDQTLVRGARMKGT